MTNQAIARCAESGANGEFFFAGGGAGEKEIGDVAATDEEEQTDSGEDDVERGAEIANDEIGEGLHPNGEMLWIIFRINSGKAFGDDVEIGFGLFGGDTGFEMSHEKPEALVGAGRSGDFGATGFFGDPHVGVPPTETRWHDADEGAGRAVEDECFIQDGGIGDEFGDPGFVSKDEHGRSTGFVIGGLHDATKKRGHSEKFKSAGSDVTAFEELRACAGTVEDIGLVVGDDAIEDVILGDVVEEFGADEATAATGAVLFGVVDLDGHEPLGVRIGEGLDEDIFEDAEDGGGGADAEGKRKDGDEGEPGGFAKVAEGVTEVVPERVHRASLVVRIYIYVWVGK